MLAANNALMLIPVKFVRTLSSVQTDIVYHAQQEDAIFVMLRNVSAVFLMLSSTMEFVSEVHQDAHCATTRLQFAEYVRKV